MGFFQNIKPISNLYLTCGELFGAVAAHDSSAALPVLPSLMYLEEVLGPETGLTGRALHHGICALHTDKGVSTPKPVAAMQPLQVQV